MKSDSTMKAIVLLIICTFFWGSCFPIGKHALDEVHALTLVFWRFVIAAACLGLYIKAARMPKPQLSSRQWLWVIAVSAVGVGGLNLGLFTGLAYTNATNGSLIMALSPLMTSLIACIALRTLPSFSQCFSLLVSLTGVLMVITNGHLETLFSMEINHGDKLIFCGMLAWSLYTYFSQGISRWMPVIPYTFVGMLSGAAVIGAMCLASPEVHPFAELWNSSTLGGVGSGVHRCVWYGGGVSVVVERCASPWFGQCRAVLQLCAYFLCADLFYAWSSGHSATAGRDCGGDRRLVVATSSFD